MSLKYNVSAVPKFVLFRDGFQVDVLDGADPIELNKKISALVIPVFFFYESYLCGQCIYYFSTIYFQLIKGGKKGEKQVEDIDLRLKSLINSAPVMLFMKGSKSEPKCKFSTAIVNLLKEIGADFSTFDILEDQVVREKLKIYSKWPTYPQVLSTTI